MSAAPRLMHTAIDATEPRALAEFYRQLLGLRYRNGDESAGVNDPDREEDWLVLVDGRGRRVLAFNRVDQLPRPTWPQDESVPKQMHLDLELPDRAALEVARSQALELGAELLLDRSDDPDEALYALADPAGHPFCLLTTGP